MARIINQNNEVIATKNKDEKKVVVSKTSFIVGLSLIIAAVAVIIVMILFLTKKNNENEKKATTPLLEYVENYENKTTGNYRIKVMDGLKVSNGIPEWDGECYILIYDTSWNTDPDYKSDLYKSYANLDAFLTGSKKADGSDISYEPFLDVLQNCGKDIMFFIVDFNSVKKSDDDQNKEYFKLHDGTSMSNLDAPMLFHYIDGEKYDNMNDPDLKLADYTIKPNQWGSIIRGEVEYLYSLKNK